MVRLEKSKRIIIVAAVIAAICLAGIFGFFNTTSKQKKISRLKLEIVKTSLEKYNLEKTQYPESLLALKEAKYLGAEELLDFWGSEFIYIPCFKEVEKKRIVITYMLSSAGPDKKAWTKDDIQ